MNKEEASIKRREYYSTHKEESKVSRQKYYSTHKEQIKEALRKWKLANPELHRNRLSGYNKKRYRAYQVEVFSHYSNGTMRCAHCGFDDIRALSIDHINGGGEKARREQGFGDRNYRWLIKNHFPDGLQVLCMNCQFIKRHTNNEFPNFRPLGQNRLI